MTQTTKTIRTSVPEPLYRRFRAATALAGVPMSEVILAAIEAHVRDLRLIDEPVRTEEHVTP